MCVCVTVCVCEPQAQATYEPKKQVTLKLPRFSYLCTNPWAAATFFLLRMQCLRSLCRLMGQHGEQFLANSKTPMKKGTRKLQPLQANGQKFHPCNSNCQQFLANSKTPMKRKQESCSLCRPMGKSFIPVIPTVSNFLLILRLP